MHPIAVRQTVRRAVAAGSLLTLLATFGCGSDDKSADDPSSPSASSTASAGAPPAGGIDPEQLQEIQECLEAAGIDTPSGPPSGMPTDMPTGMPTDMPTDMPSDMPSGGPGGQLNDPEVQAALEACGIELPQGMPSAPS